ncbi:MAG: autotransporter outer membrane beta-barrel domain-containing protein [Vulcanococcus sp.]
MNRRTRLGLIALLAMAAGGGPARAQFSGSYAPPTWTLIQNNSNGTVNTSGAPGSIVITAPGLVGNVNGGTITYSNTARLTGIYKFNWNFTNTQNNDDDLPQFVINDNAINFSQYVLGSGLFSQSGAETYSLSRGDTFGFRIDDVDNDSFVGILTISNFLYPVLYSSALQPYADIQSVSLDAIKNQRELILSQAGDCKQRGWLIGPEGSRTCLFVSGAYASGNINGSVSLGSYNSGNTSSAYGVEWKPGEQWAIGAAYGYGTANLSDFNFQGSSAQINSNINSINAYGVYQPDKNWKIAAITGYSNFSHSGYRTFLGDTAKANFSSTGYTAALQASYEFRLRQDSKPSSSLNPIRIRPLVNLAWAGNDQAGFTETGNTFLLNVNGQASNSLIATAGTAIELPIALNKARTTVLTPRAGLAYQYDMLANSTSNRTISATAVDVPSLSLTETGQNRGSNTLYLDFGADLQINRNFGLYADVNYQAFSNGNELGYPGGLRANF